MAPKRCANRCARPRPTGFRFSLAHELGHVILHDEPGATAVQERQADEFASEMLLPADTVRREPQRG
jgi:Zn-dependent peptidase ImmA (M78 family)